MLGLRQKNKNKTKIGLYWVARNVWAEKNGRETGPWKRDSGQEEAKGEFGWGIWFPNSNQDFWFKTTKLKHFQTKFELDSK
jgi:hypothetical protein